MRRPVGYPRRDERGELVEHSPVYERSRQQKDLLLGEAGSVAAEGERARALITYFEWT